MTVSNPEDITYTAMCLWEAVIELQSRNREAVEVAFEVCGWIHIRHFTMELAADCYDAWEVDSFDGYDACFDWEFVPHWLERNVEWTNDGPERKVKSYMHLGAQADG
jgi:hypothetical protein